MQRIEFKQKTIELAQSSQYFIDSLWEIGNDVAKHYAAFTSDFSSFFDLLYSIFYYQLSLSELVKGFTLSRFDLFFPYNLETDKVILKRSKQLTTQTEKFTIPFLVNLSIVRAVSKMAIPIAKEPSKLTPLLKSQEPEIKARVSDKHLAEASHEIFVQHIVEFQNYLWSSVTPSINKLTSNFLEIEKPAIPITFLVAASKPMFLDRTVFAGSLPERFVTPEQKPSLPERFVTPEQKPSLPEQPSKIASRERPLSNGFTAKPETSEFPRAVVGLDNLSEGGFAAKLLTAVAEKQKPFLKMIAYISQILSSQVAATERIEPYYGHARFTLKQSTQILPDQTISLKENSPKFASWIHEETETLRRAQVSLSAFPIAAKTVEKHLNETLIQPISNLEVTEIHWDQEATSQNWAATGFKPEVKPASVEAFRLPSILTSLIADNIQTFPWLSPEGTVSQIYQTLCEFERLTLEKPEKTTEILEAKKQSKLPIALALAAAGKLLTQRWQYESVEFMKEIQISRSTYSRLAELGAAGPIRTTMLGELAAGLTIPNKIETYPSNGSPVSQQSIRQSSMTPETQDSVNVNVFADTDQEDLRELDRKIKRILSEQISRYYGSSSV